MRKSFILPDLGEGLTEASIVRWLVAPGDTVVVDQPVVEVESAKSTVELPCPFAGVIGELHAAEGDVVNAGEALLTMAEEGAETADADGATSGATADDAAGELVPGTALRADESESGAVLVGYGVATRSRTRARRSGRFDGRSDRASVPAPPAVSEAPHAGRSPVVSPLVRRLAREHGFSAEELAGTGPGALVLRADVERRIAELDAASASPARATTSEGDVRIPLTGVRKVVAERMSASRREVPEATIWLDVDATRLLEAKARLDAVTGERWSVNALIARFVVAGLKAFPVLNSSIDEAAGEIVQHSSIHLGIAAQTVRGLMVPVVRDADRLTTEGLRDAIADIVESSKTGDFAPDRLRGGTFTLNNYGGFGVDGSAPIINQPEVAMLGIGRIIDRPWVVDGELAVRKVVVLSMVFDHRVCDGDIPSQFITFVARCIEDPVALLGHL